MVLLVRLLVYVTITTRMVQCFWFVAYKLNLCMYIKPERLIDLIIHRDYWEIINVQTIIVMSINYILSKEIPSETRSYKLFGAKYNV